MRTLKLLTILTASLSAFTTARADTLPAAVARPLVQAEHLIAANQDQAALAKLQQLSRQHGLTPATRAIIYQLTGAASAGAQQFGPAAAAYQAALATGQVAPAQRTLLIQAIAGYLYQAQDFSGAATWVRRYQQAGGQDPRTIGLLPQADYQAADYNAAARDAAAQIAQYTRSDQTPPPALLQLRVAAAQKTGDKAAYQAALLAVLASSPSPAYWTEAIDNVTAAPNFPDTLTLDVYRLRLATGTLTAPADYEDYTERAILAGRAQEAKFVIQKAFSSGILTAQTDNGHAGRLLTLLTSQPAQPASATPPAAPKSSAALTDLDAGIAAFQAGDTARAAARFQSASTEAPPDSPAANLAQLWAIRAGTTE